MHFLILPLLTGTILFAGEGPVVPADPRFTEAEAQLQLLHQGNASQREAASKKLLSLGFYAREAVRKGMKSDDPEVATQCAAIWKDIEMKVTPIEVPGLEAFIKAARDKHVDGEAWAQVVKSQGPSALALVEPYLTEEFFDGGSAEVRKPGAFPTEVEMNRRLNLKNFWPALLADEDFALFSWSQAAPDKRALCLKALSLVHPGENLDEIAREMSSCPQAPLGLQEQFLKLLLKLDPDALLPHLESALFLPDLEFAQLLLQDKQVLAKMTSKGGMLRALRRALPVMGATTREAKAEALRALPDDAFIEFDGMLHEILMIVAQAGLATESKRLKSGVGSSTAKGRQLAEDILAGKGGVPVNTFTCPDIDTYLTLTLLSNGDQTRERLAYSLQTSGCAETDFTNLQLESLQEKAPSKFYDHLKGLSPDALKSYQLYRIARLNQQDDARSDLEAALQAAPHCLPLLLENALVAPLAERSNAIHRLCLALPTEIELGNWLLYRLSCAKMHADAEVMDVWMKKIDLSKLTEVDSEFYLLVNHVLEQGLDAKRLLPVLKKATSIKALVALSCGQRGETLAILKTMREESRMDQDALLLEFLLGGARPDVDADANEEWAAVFAGFDARPCPMCSKKKRNPFLSREENQLRINGAWELGKGFVCLRQGDSNRAVAALEKASHARSDWGVIFKIFLAHPELLAPEKK